MLTTETPKHLYVPSFRDCTNRVVVFVPTELMTLLRKLEGSRPKYDDILLCMSLLLCPFCFDFFFFCV